MELWDVYDKDKQFTGKVVQRSFNQPFAQGEYGLAVHAIIFNDNNEILIQKRQNNQRVISKSMGLKLWRPRIIRRN